MKKNVLQVNGIFNKNFSLSVGLYSLFLLAAAAIKGSGVVVV